MQAHRDLMLFARRLWRCMMDAGRVVDSLQQIHIHEGQELTPEISDHLRRLDDAFRPLDYASKQLDALLADVQMFCSQEARDAALRFEMAQMKAMLDVHAFLAGNGHRKVDGVSFYERWPRDVVPVTAFIMGEYASIVRADLRPDS